MMADKRFVKGSVKKKTFENGGEVLKVQISIEDLLRCPMSSKKYVYLEIASKKNGPDEYGRTHNISIDDYDPEDVRHVNQDMVAVADYIAGTKNVVHLEEGKDTSGSDLPF